MQVGCGRETNGYRRQAQGARQARLGDLPTRPVRQRSETKGDRAVPAQTRTRRASRRHLLPQPGIQLEKFLTYGLPVLVPAWRRHLDLLRGSLPYTEQSFRSVIDEMTEQKLWQAASDEAYDQALRLDWEETLRPLEDLLAGVGDGSDVAGT